MDRTTAERIAQQRANRLQKRVVVYRKTGEVSAQETAQGYQNYYTTPDREDLPDEWLIISICDPE
jgi:adenine/guanine phosphoribosyltransferase-like PRPP-binding protein